MNRGGNKYLNAKNQFHSIVIGLIYVLSTNSIFIPAFGYSFNPSKLLLLILLPVLYVMLKPRIKIRIEDVFFIFFILFVVTKGVFTGDVKLITGIFNYLVPYSFYKVYENRLAYFSLNKVIVIIIAWSILHSSLGLLQFFSGDKSLLVVGMLTEFKIIYAREFAFNPFDELTLLPHGLYSYSSVLAISLIFPAFLAFGIKEKMGWLLFSLVFSLFFVTVFATFSRFEILSMLVLMFMSILVIKPKKIIFKRLIILYVMFIVILAVYLFGTSDEIGTVNARLITVDMLSQIFTGWDDVFFGLTSMYMFKENYGVDIPHNMYVFMWVSYGFFGAIFLIAYFGVKLYKFYYFYKRYCHYKTT